METTSTTFAPTLSINSQSSEMLEYALLQDEEIQRLTLNSVLDTMVARITVRKLANARGYSLLEQLRISIAIFEIARDFVAYAGQGEIIVSWREGSPKYKGLVFYCHDCGLNEARLTTKLQANGSNSSSKLGFLKLRRLVDEFEFTKDPKDGNCITVIKWIS